jgi:hypothetical protein
MHDYAAKIDIFLDIKKERREYLMLSILTTSSSALSISLQTAGYQL